MKKFKNFTHCLFLSIGLLFLASTAIYADIVVNILVVNGTDVEREKKIYQHLPRELEFEDILDTAGFEVEFDVTNGQYVVYGDVTLSAKESKTFRVKVRDVWQIEPSEVEEIRNQINANHDLVEFDRLIASPNDRLIIGKPR